MSVGIDGCMGKSMIREGKGLDVYVRRSLRDIFKKVPTFSLEVKVNIVYEIAHILGQIIHIYEVSRWGLFNCCWYFNKGKG